MQVATCRDFLTPASRRQLVATCAVLNLAVLLPTASSWAEGRASAGAISLAVADANKKFPVKVSFVWEEVDCDDMQATAAISRMMRTHVVDAVIGPDCEVSCETSASFTAVWNIAQISYSCSSDLLSDKRKYPTVAPSRFPLSALATLLRCRAIALAMPSDCSLCAWVGASFDANPFSSVYAVALLLQQCWVIKAPPALASCPTS
jgi:ABC-type branched-subunit amino acid transport system substrate-binding protein